MRSEIKALTATLLFVTLAVAQSTSAAECPSYGGGMDGAESSSVPGDRCARSDRILDTTDTWSLKVQIPSHIPGIVSGPETRAGLSLFAGIGVVFLLVGRHRRRMF